MGPEGAKSFGKLLTTNETLTQLDVSDNQMKAEGAAALADGLLSNSVLLCLHVFSNQMGSEGGKLLASAITAHPNYIQIAMSMFDGKTDVDMSKKKGLDAGDGHIIAAALESNSAVHSIVIGSQGKPATIPLKQLRENSVKALDFEGKQLLALGGIASNE
jgi:hypothetical protein